MLDTAISPELIPDHDPDGDKPGQSSESVVGPYELQDFFLYYTLRFGYRPSKVAFLAHHAWGDRDRGRWPDLIPQERRNEYTLAEIKHWLEVFLSRFFQISQFKRSAIPNAPKVGSGGSLSPRGDWRAPSDGNADTWLAELRKGVPDSLTTPRRILMAGPGRSAAATPSPCSAPEARWGSRWRATSFAPGSRSGRGTALPTRPDHWPGRRRGTRLGSRGGGRDRVVSDDAVRRRRRHRNAGPALGSAADGAPGCR